MRILLRVAYDGTAYHGWQVQSTQPLTIEGVLNRSLGELIGEDISVIGASRTDAGVHARDNVAVFDTKSSIPPEKYVQALNSILPKDIRVMSSYEVDKDYHPRHVNTQKTYCYHIYHADICPPMERLYRHHAYGPLDTDAMNKACAAFIGEHDFAAFCAAGSQAETTKRTVYELSVKEYNEYIDIYVTGNGFLYNMVRIIAGTLLEVGRGRINPEDIPRIIESCDRSCAGPTLPPCGLCLERIKEEPE